MTLHQVLVLAAGHPWLAAGLAFTVLVVAVGTLWLLVRAVRRLDLPPAPVVVAGLGAAVCTAYSADTSWRFAEDHLGMSNPRERAVMFAAGELALFACAFMARANKGATTTEETAGTAGVPGVLVWCITGIQIVPAFSESGVWGGIVRAAFGPIAAGLLWHLAMGLEIQVVRPGALSTGLPALVGRELRERLLSRLGLAVRDRTAEQITRDRATVRAVRLAALLELRPTGWRAAGRRRRLAAAVARSGAGTDEEQRHRLLQQLTARRTSGQLATVPVASPWTGTPVPGPPSPTPLAVGTAPEAPGPERPALAPVPEQAPCAELDLDVTTTALVHPDAQCRVPVLAAAGTRTPQVHVRVADGTFLESLRFPQPDPEHSAVPDHEVPVPGVHEVPVPEPVGVPDEDDDGVPEGDRDVPDPDPLIAAARAEYGDRVPGIRPLRARYGIGQDRAQRIRDALTPEGATAP
ncbi:hypothetical protein [Streptomyces sp. NPDC060198]|uniref:hypothetical protein n=1 Tax=Streptomyces sp. NPDC060198 TaxID=3347070 RepID=UPI0036636002